MSIQYKIFSIQILFWKDEEESLNFFSECKEKMEIEHLIIYYLILVLADYLGLMEAIV
jgi:hypothetical protein